MKCILSGAQAAVVHALSPVTHDNGTEDPNSHDDFGLVYADIREWRTHLKRNLLASGSGLTYWR